MSTPSWSQGAGTSGDRAWNKAKDLEGRVALLENLVARGLWECLLLSGADVSAYCHETRTYAGREVGFRAWMRRGSVDEVVKAVRELRRDYDEKES